jgi:hypothetical protein
MNERFRGFRVDGPGASGGGRTNGPVAVVARIVGAIAAVGFFALTLFLGAFVLVGVVAAAVVGAVVFRIWYWWQTRGMRDDDAGGRFGAGASGASRGGSGPFSGEPAGRHTPPREGAVVDGEYEVLDEDEGGTGEHDDRDGAGSTTGSRGEGAARRR